MQFCQLCDFDLIFPEKVIKTGGDKALPCLYIISIQPISLYKGYYDGNFPSI